MLVSQIVLPITLAFIMLVMGLGLAKADFANIVSRPKVALIGLLLQLFLLPCLAILLAFALQLSPQASAGLVLLSLCPGGATSNAFSLFAKGDVALSVSLTAITSVIVPFTLPLCFATYLLFVGSNSDAFSLPILNVIKQLALVTLLPVAIGMLAKRYFPTLVARMLPIARKVAGLAMLVVILLLMITNWSTLTQSVSKIGVAVVSLCLVAMLLTYWLSTQCQFSAQTKRTLTIEVGVQNAGTAMLVAFSILQQPELALVPLMYGLLMNIPALTFLLWVHQQDAQHAKRPIL